MRLRELVDQHLSTAQKRFLKFGIVGASGVAVNLAFVWLGLEVMRELEEATRNAFASALGIAVSVISNFVLNDLWTWGDREKGVRKRDLAARFGAYCLASGAAVMIQYGCAQVLSQAFDWNLYLAQLIGIILGMALNFVVNNRWTFRNRGDKG